MGTTAVFYVHSFNHIMKLYRESGYTLTWAELIEKKLPEWTSPAHNRS
jgi:hypothetical protein